ncbi:C40 family peptidase [Clostridium hydrogenum]|uniref:C40 family peptidase n=1 Tax=Clostridium hydrogenum TaxID=2855764 RepID=UPI002E350FEC|nr:NlpC/P60 family protein [Clostridium hydrogenum]
MHKKLLAAFVALGITLSFSGNAFASPLQDQYNSSLQQYQNAMKNVQALESQIEIMDGEIGKVNDTITATDKKISQTKSSIAATQRKLDEAKVQMDNEEKIYGQRIRAMYMNGNVQYLSVVLNCNNFSDFVSNIELVQKLMQYDKNIIQNFDSQKQHIEDVSKDLAKKNNDLVYLQNQNKNKLQDLNDKKAKQNNLIVEAKAEEAKHSSEMKSIQAAIDAETKKLQAIKIAAAVTPAKVIQNTANNTINNNNNNNKPSPISTPSGVSGMAVVAFASQYVGVPYLWGGTTPNGFDCSGLVQYAYARFGISLPRTSQEQVGSGVPVTGNLQPGDLLFFEPSSSGPQHVGMYVGDNMFIEAPHTGANVRIVPIRPYCAARRIIR